MSLKFETVLDGCGNNEILLTDKKWGDYAIYIVADDYEEIQKYIDNPMYVLEAGEKPIKIDAYICPHPKSVKKELFDLYGHEYGDPIIINELYADMSALNYVPLSREEFKDLKSLERFLKSKEIKEYLDMIMVSKENYIAKYGQCDMGEIMNTSE